MSERQGIILAGGLGTRLSPLTDGTTKQLLPIYDKPMVFYPLSTLMQAGITDILIVAKQSDIDTFHRLLGDGSKYGLNLAYGIQDHPNGIADAFNVGKDFVKGSVALILGDNFFHGKGIEKTLKSAARDHDNARLFGYQVPNPESFGVISFGCDGSVKSLKEKPALPETDIAAVGLYFYPSDVLEKVRDLQKSSTGELEITCLNNVYLSEGRLLGELLGPGTTWFDAGTVDTLLNASNFVRDSQLSNGQMIGCLEEIALKNNLISPRELEQVINKCPNSDYFEYVKALITG